MIKLFRITLNLIYLDIKQVKNNNNVPDYLRNQSILRTKHTKKCKNQNCRITPFLTKKFSKSTGYIQQEQENLVVQLAECERNVIIVRFVKFVFQYQPAALIIKIKQSDQQEDKQRRRPGLHSGRRYAFSQYFSRNVC